MKKMFGLILTVLALSGCYENGLDAEEKNADVNLDYRLPGGNPSDFPNDYYRIIGITPMDDQWNVVVEYPGGCNEHSFYTWWDGTNNSGNLSFFLYHNSNGDACEALVRDTIRLDMQIVLYGENLSKSNIYAINASTSKSINIAPEIAALTQGTDCSHKASLSGTACGQGIWDNQWFSLNEEINGYDKVWLQPVKNNESVTLTKPEVGKYKIAFTLLMGYEYPYADATLNCQSLPEGTILPISINCMEKLD